MLTVRSWNMDKRESAWRHLDDLVAREGASVALLQEARRPERPVQPGWVVHPPVEDGDRWRIAVPRRYRAGRSLHETRRWYASAIVGGGDRVLAPQEPTELHDVVDGDLAISHPGQFAVADVGIENGRHVTVVSLYGIWDRMPDGGPMYAEATLHRAISDLTPIFQKSDKDYVLVAGDLNAYSYSDGTAAGDRSATVLSRLATYGLDVVGPYRPDGEARLDRCPCPDIDCRHVNTFLYRSDRKSWPHQLDYFLASPALRERLVRCWADPDPAWPEHSDHRPIFATFDA